MGVRPPTNGGDDPEHIEFGIAAVDARLERADLVFPATSEEIAAEIGESRVPYDGSGNKIALADALEETGIDRFDSRQELLNELHPVFEEYRRRASNSVVRQVRSLLPF